MASNDESSGIKKPTGSSPSGKRPHATLDLKAVEIKDRTQKRGGEPEMPQSQAGSGKETSNPGTSSTAAGDQTIAKDDDPASASMSENLKGAGTAAPPPLKTKQRGRVFGPFMAGALAGLLVLFGGDWAWQTLGLPKLAGSATRSMDAIELRLADLEQQFNTGEGTDVAVAAQAETLDTITSQLEDVKTLSKTTGQLVSQQAELRQQIATLARSPTSAADVTNIAQRLQDLEQQIDAIGAAAKADPDAGPIPQMTALTDKVAELEAGLADQNRAIEESRIGAEAEQRLNDAVSAATAAKTETQRLDGAFAEVKSTATRQNQRIEALRTETDRLTESIKVLNESTLKMSSDVSTLRRTLEAELGAVARPADINAAVTPYKDRIANLERDLQALKQAEANRAAQAQNVVLSLELANLERTINAGEPYQNQLLKVKGAAPGPLPVDTLEPYSATGVPTLATLQENFRPLIHSMLAASQTETDPSLFDRFINQAKSVVRIRRVNHDPDDTSVEAVVARMETDLNDGNLGAVLDHAKALPADNAAPARAWLDQVAARTAVDRVLTTLEAELKSSLSNTNLTPAR